MKSFVKYIQEKLIINNDIVSSNINKINKYDDTMYINNISDVKDLSELKKICVELFGDLFTSYIESPITDAYGWVQLGRINDKSPDKRNKKFFGAIFSISINYDEYEASYFYTKNMRKSYIICNGEKHLKDAIQKLIDILRKNKYI